MKKIREKASRAGLKIFLSTMVKSQKGNVIVENFGWIALTVIVMGILITAASVAFPDLFTAMMTKVKATFQY